MANFPIKKWIEKSKSRLVFLWLSLSGITMVHAETISLPPPVKNGEYSLEQLLQQRRSVREFRPGTLSLHYIGQLLWAAQGLTHNKVLRAAPSAGALYPLELYLVAGSISNLSAGVYHYQAKSHRLTLHVDDDQRIALARAALSQHWIAEASGAIIFTAKYRRVTAKYGERSYRYTHIETGCATQNLFLQAEALNLGSVIVGAFDDAKLSALLQLPADLTPLIIMPVGLK